jgi:hypothetical protein
MSYATKEIEVEGVTEGTDSPQFKKKVLNCKTLAPKVFD